MINIDDKTRRLSQATIVIGYKQENKAESIEFKIPDYLKEYGKKICFKTKDGKVFSKLFDNTTSNIFTFTRTETQYGELDATIQFFKAEDEDIIIYKTSMLHITFKDAVICEDEIQPDDPKYPIIEDLIIKVSNITKDITTINKNIEDIDKKNNEQDTKIQTNKTDIADIKKVNIKQDNNIKELQTENEQLKNQIPNGQASGNAIHIEDSSDLELKWKLKGGHKQEIGENSPSPNYPSEIETVGSNINLFDKDNVNKINAYFDSTIHSNSANRVFWLKIDKNQDYTISKVKGKVFGIAFTDQLPKAGVKIYGTKYNNTGEVITTNSGSYDYLVCYYWSTSDVLTEQQIIDSIKIEKGTVATPYSLYNQGSVRINVVNKNLFDKNNANKLRGYIDNSGYLHYDTNNKIIYVKCKTNTDYVISSKNIKGVAFFNKVPKTGSTSTNFKILTTTELTLNSKENTYLACWYYSSTLSLTEQEILNSIQIEQGLKATAYVEHQSETVTMPIQQEMLEGDYIDDVEHHEWKKLILTGSESNIKKIPTDTYNRFQLSLTSYGVRNYIYCTHYLAGNSVNSGELDISFDGKYIVIHSPSDEITTEEQFKTWLKQQYDAGTPVIVYYKLATPFDLELTTEQKAIREQKLHTYKNVTNISLSNDLSSVYVSYKKDLETIFNNLQSSLIADIEKPK